MALAPQDVTVVQNLGTLVFPTEHEQNKRPTRGPPTRVSDMGETGATHSHVCRQMTSTRPPTLGEHVPSTLNPLSLGIHDPVVPSQLFGDTVM